MTWFNGIGGGLAAAGFLVAALTDGTAASLGLMVGVSIAFGVAAGNIVRWANPMPAPGSPRRRGTWRELPPTSTAPPCRHCYGPRFEWRGLVMCPSCDRYPLLVGERDRGRRGG
jgi:hypothetical protein